jgi:ABC-2 type transport system ATP-binding protein
MASIRFPLIALLLLLHGCGTVDVRQRYAEHDSTLAQEADYYDVDIPTHDGLLLRATVYQPALKPGEEAPLIVHTHGFGAFRAPRPMSIYGQLIISGQAAIAAWRQGYWVISYDQRGFGDSDGEVMLMHPDYEVRDMSSVIDWAQSGLPRLKRDGARDPVIGTIGESYGGAVQILASQRDSRIDALVPIATWYDLRQILAPDKHFKSAWGSLLLTLGSLGSGFDFGMALQDDYLNLLTTGTLSDFVSHDLALRSPRAYCERGQSIRGDALFLQGFRDTLMPANEGYRNWQCALKGGRDARLIGIRDGHILPWPLQGWSGMPLFNTQETVVCGDKRFRTLDLILRWWDEKLKGIAPSEQTKAPPLCIAYSDDEGIEPAEFLSGGPTFQVRKTEIKLAQTGLFEMPLAPMDWLWDQATGWLADPLSAERQASTGSWVRPAFIPLVSVNRPTGLAGIPLLDVELKTTGSTHDGAVFVALGVRKPGSSYTEVLGEQYTPLADDGRHQVEMPAVAHRLHPGETVGLMVQGFTGQYFLNARGWRSFGSVAGSIRLPLIAP